MKKNNGGIRTVITAGILLVLVIAVAWTLKQKKADASADAEIKIETPGEADDAPEEPVTEVTETPTEAEPTADPSAADEAARQEQEKSTFVTDYESEPLLSATPIKYLSLEVGGTDGEIRLNWMSPSSSAGQVSWYTVQNGDLQMVTADCSSVPDYAGILCKQSNCDRTSAGHDLCI